MEHYHFEGQHPVGGQKPESSQDRILMSDLFHRTLSRHQDTHFVEFGKHPQRTVGQHHLVWRHLIKECAEGKKFQDESRC